MNSGFFFINNSRYQSVRSAVLDSSRLTLTNFLAEEVFLHLFLFDELRISSLCRPTRRLDSLDSTNWAKPPGPRPRPLRGTRRPVKLLKSKNRTVPKQRPAVDLDYAQSLAICLAVAPALSASLLSIGQYSRRCSFCHRKLPFLSWRRLPLIWLHHLLFIAPNESINQVRESNLYPHPFTTERSCQTTVVAISILAAVLITNARESSRR